MKNETLYNDHFHALPIWFISNLLETRSPHLHYPLQFCSYSTGDAKSLGTGFVIEILRGKLSQKVPFIEFIE